MNITILKDYQTVLLLVCSQLENIKERYYCVQENFYLHEVKAWLKSSRSWFRNWR